MIRVEEQEYQGFFGSVAWDAARDGPRPGVLIFHAFGGRADLEAEAARRLAGLGYAGFAADVYGTGRRAESREEASAWMGALDADRDELLRRAEAALGWMRASPLADPARLAAIGFCFGGKCALDLARSGADLRAAISFHGLYDAPGLGHAGPIPAAILIAHGWNDPLAPPASVVALAEELTARAADWQLLAFGGTGHAFTNPAAADRAGGMAFHEENSRRAWRAAEALLADRLG